MNMDANEKVCAVGDILNDSCHKLHYCRKIGFRKVELLDSEVQEVIMWRSGLSLLHAGAEICLHHERLLTSKFASMHNKCFDPFNSHKKNAKRGLVEISLKFAKEMVQHGITGVVPGYKICPSCRMKVEAQMVCIEAREEPTAIDEEESILVDPLEREISASSSRDSINISLGELDVSPLKLHSVPHHAKVKHGKRKLKQATDAFSTKVASALQIQSADLVDDREFTNTAEDMERNSNDLKHMVNLMKEKVKDSNRRRKIQILTLTPKSWSIRKAAKEFQVSKKAIQKARKLKEEQGILALPELVASKRLDKDIIDAVHAMYNDDEYTRQLPGKKDYISTAKNVHVSKRLILCNLKELYVIFKEKRPEITISFSKFASLRPKWCVPVGPKGTHSVCVCTMHQNLKLMLAAVGFEKSYHSLIEMIVCDRESKKCMVHRCESCPGINNVMTTLKRVFFSIDDDDDNENDSDKDISVDEFITYKQWTTNDRAELVSLTTTVGDFIEDLCGKLDKITAHSYIAKAQATYLKLLKERMVGEEVIVLGDFAENYKFVVQDEIQGYHWNQNQCSLHPVVIYHRCNPANQLTSRSLCFISDDLEHDVYMVYEVIATTAKYVKENISTGINVIHYFSDGCAGQYKNCKHFLNLCYHQEDFGVGCQWNFFATSHGKSPCDGVGGTVKRAAAKASLQRPMEEQILSAKTLFDYCDQELLGIDFFYLEKSRVEWTRTSLKDRLRFAKTIPGTRSFHQIVPLPQNVIGAKRVSEDREFVLTFSFTASPTDIPHTRDLKPGSFVVSVYDNNKWLGVVCQIDKENRDVQIKFMHPHFPACSLEWPTREDVCWVPDVNIVLVVDAPVPSTQSGRQYCLSTSDLTKVEESFY